MPKLRLLSIPSSSFVVVNWGGRLNGWHLAVFFRRIAQGTSYLAWISAIGNRSSSILR